jgi:hypothetical protein
MFPYPIVDLFSCATEDEFPPRDVTKAKFFIGVDRLVCPNKLSLFAAMRHLNRKRVIF